MSKDLSVRRVEAELMDYLCERGCLVGHARTARGSLVLHGRRRQAEQLQMAPRSRELGGSANGEVSSGGAGQPRTDSREKSGRRTQREDTRVVLIARHTQNSWFGWGCPGQDTPDTVLWYPPNGSTLHWRSSMESGARYAGGQGVASTSA